MSSPTAGKYVCPACGGFVDEASRNCAYCASPVATARCAHCSHMNIPDAVHCSGCGRKLGLEPLGKPDDLKCPDCQVPFEAFCGGPGLLRDCARCGGQFVEHALVRELIERHQAYGSVAPRRHKRETRSIDPCATCAVPPAIR